MRQLNNIERAYIIAQRDARISYRNIQTMFNNKYNRIVSLGTISKIYNERVKRQFPPRRRLSTLAQDKQIIRIILENRETRWKSWRDLCKLVKRKLKITLSPRTLRRREKQNWICSYVANKKFRIKPDVSKKRLEYALEYVNKPVSFWERYIIQIYFILCLKYVYIKTFYFKNFFYYIH